MNKELLDYATTKDPVTGCWNHNGYITNGYSEIYIEGKRYYVHRLAASIFLGFDLTSKLQICHKCDNRRCWNPDHLFIGTMSDNIRDMHQKGRGDNPNSGVTHCIHGHEFTKENTNVVFERGYEKRQCKKCKSLRYFAKKAQRRQAILTGE